MMAVPYENKSIEEIRSLIINGLQQQWNNRLRILPKSFIKVLATVLAAVFIVVYKQIGWLFLQIFPETAYWKEITVLGVKVRPLVKWGVLIGIGEPNSGKQWRGETTVHVNQINSVLISGTQLKSDITGKIYLVDETKTLENEIETVKMSCVEVGKAGSLALGDILNFVSPLGFVEKEAEVFAVLDDAMDAETEPEYRFRVVNRWRMQPQGGALADYRTWALEVAGVLNVYPYTDPDNGGGILLYVSGNPSVYPDRIPSASLLIQVGEACIYDSNRGGKAYRKPLGAIIDPDGDQTYSNILPVSVIFFDIYILGLQNILPQDFADVVKSPIKNYFLEREPYIRGLSNDNNKTDIVSKNNVFGIVDQIAISVKAEFDSVIMRRNDDVISFYYLGMGELSELRNLYINGVLY
jgi:hypothetical protein